MTKDEVTRLAKALALADSAIAAAVAVVNAAADEIAKAEAPAADPEVEAAAESARASLRQLYDAAPPEVRRGADAARKRERDLRDQGVSAADGTEAPKPAGDDRGRKAPYSVLIREIGRDAAGKAGMALVDETFNERAWLPISDLEHDDLVGPVNEEGQRLAIELGQEEIDALAGTWVPTGSGPVEEDSALAAASEGD